MSGYARGPNVSQYIANLNAIPQQPAPGAGSQQLGAQDPLSGFDDDLALFTNSELFDFDLGNVKQENYIDDGAGSKQAKQHAAEARDEYGNNAANFGVFDPSQQMAPLNTNFANQNFDPQIFQSPQSATFAAHQTQMSNAPSPTAQQAGQKRPHSSGSPPESVEDVARMAAEEDKRRRNTAASARFRVKKKQREAALEKSAKENAEMVENLQKRVTELEMENKWLRELVVQKEGKTVNNKADSGVATGPEVTISNKQVKKGVGTEA